MQVTVFGASGKVGSIVVTNLLTRGHTVRIFQHSSSRYQESPETAIIQGDIHNATDVLNALKGSDAVISALGSWGTKSKDILTAGMTSIIPSMKTANVTRIVSLTGADAWVAGEQQSSTRKVLHKIISFTAAKILHDGEQHIALLQQSDLDWTVLRSPVMSSKASDEFELSNSFPGALERVSRHAVAAAMVSQLDSKDFTRQAPFVTQNSYQN